MIEFLSWRLQGMPFFKDQTFDLSRKGVSLILGKNLDSSNSNTNAAGKSFFFNELAELLSFKPMIGERQDTVRRGSRELTFKKGGHLYVVDRSFTKKGKENLTIQRDGKDLEFRELSAAKQKLQQLIPYTEQEILSLFFIDARIPHPLVRGSSAARREFFLRFFKMGSSSHLRKLINAELDDIKRSEGSIDELKARVAKLKASSDKDPEALKARRDKLKNRLETLDGQVSRFRKVQSILEAYKDSKPALSSLKEFGVKTAKEARSIQEEWEAELSKCRRELRAWKNYHATEEELQDAVTKRRRLSKQIGGDPKEFKQQESELKERLEALTAKEESRAAEVLSVEEKGSDEESTLRVLRREAKEVQARIEALQKVSDTCPSCGQAWTNKHAKKELAEAEERLHRVKKAVSKKKTEVETLIAEHTEAKARLEKTKAKRIACQDQLVPYTLYFSISIPESAEPPEREEKFLKSQVTRLEEQIEVLSSAAMHLPNKVAYAALTEEDKELAEGEDPTDRYLEITQKVAELEVRIEDARNDAKELEETRERLTALKTKIQDKDALELLLQAFSKKGVDALRIKTVTDRLGQLVNKYAKFMFPEDYTFSFELETQFSFLVTRKYGKRVETSDVRKLSGAESLLFNLVLYVSLLSFVPASIRPSVLILDEPTSTFGPEMIDAFIKFLPVLNSVVPHIIVITPMPYVDYPGAKVFTVVKKNGVSKFVEGGVA